MALTLTPEEHSTLYDLLIDRVKATLLDDPETNNTEVETMISTLRKMEER